MEVIPLAQGDLLRKWTLGREAKNEVILTAIYFKHLERSILISGERYEQGRISTE